MDELLAEPVPVEVYKIAPFGEDVELDKEISVVEEESLKEGNPPIVANRIEGMKKQSIINVSLPKDKPASAPVENAEELQGQSVIAALLPKEDEVDILDAAPPKEATMPVHEPTKDAEIPSVDTEASKTDVFSFLESPNPIPVSPAAMEIIAEPTTEPVVKSPTLPEPPVAPKYSQCTSHKYLV